ncbi:hypothetical protein ACTQ9L_10720 [Deinococcus wulumuqiensis]
MTLRLNSTDFWRWAYSDFLSNALRGVLAEYIVAQATGCTHRARTEWDAYDLLTDDGIRIEVKSAAYLQSWEQERPSEIRFGIGLKRGWDATTNSQTNVPGRAADLYVFCLFREQAREQADPLNLHQWTFWVCPTSVLNERFPRQKTIGLAALERLGLPRVGFAALAQQIEAASLRRS